MQPISPAEFEGYVAGALDALPAELVRGFRNVVVTVADEDPADPGLLGLYDGIALTDREDYSGALPDRITVFRIPLCLLAQDTSELIEQISITVVHEFAHHVGIDDERLHELGWA